jgi:hypothetical protein
VGSKDFGDIKFFFPPILGQMMTSETREELDIWGFPKNGGPYETSLILDIMGVCPFWELYIYM